MGSLNSTVNVGSMSYDSEENGVYEWYDIFKPSNSIEDLIYLSKLADNALSVDQLFLTYQFYHIPYQVFSMYNLSVFSMTEAAIRSIPVDIANLSGLQSLNFSFNLISDVPTELSALTNLTTLKLEGNRIGVLPSELSSLSLLSILQLGWNQFNKIDECVYRLTDLQLLSFKGNQVECLSPLISSLARLVKFDMSYNKLNEINECITSLTSLATLKLNGNPLSYIPSFLSKLTRLKRLDIKKTLVEHIPRCIATRLILNIDCTPLAPLTRLVNGKRNDNFHKRISTKRWNWYLHSKGRRGIVEEYGQRKTIEHTSDALLVAKLLSYQRLGVEYNQSNDEPTTFGALPHLCLHHVLSYSMPVIPGAKLKDS